MSAATILFSDIVGFSTKPSIEQRRLVTSLTNEVVYKIRSLLNPPMGTPDVLAMPTGDGMALAFLHATDQQWDRATLLGLIWSLQQWANNERTENGLVDLRIGVHVGPVEFVTDINQNPNICGDAINFTQRVMDSANPRQVLFSDTAFREHIGLAEPAYSTAPFSKTCKAMFEGPVEVHAKHGLQLLVYKMVLSPEQEWWSNEDPISKDLMTVSLTPLPKEIAGSFGERLGIAKEIAFILLTGERFLDIYKNGDITFSTSLERFWVFIPDPTNYSHLHLHPVRASSQFTNECIERWKKLFAELNTKYKNADFKLGLFKEPPYLGASYTNWERPGGRVHISPYVWSVDAPNCPGYELEWLGRRPSPIYESYVKGLHYLNSQTTNALS